MKTRHIDTWQERCNKNNGVVTSVMIQARMQEEIDELRRVYDCARTLVTVRGRFHTEQAFKRLEECMTDTSSNDQAQGAGGGLIAGGSGSNAGLAGREDAK